MSFYDATNSVNLDDVKTKLEQQAKDANKSVTDAIKNLESNADDPSSWLNFSTLSTNGRWYTTSTRPPLVRSKM